MKRIKQMKRIALAFALGIATFTPSHAADSIPAEFRGTYCLAKNLNGNNFIYQPRKTSTAAWRACRDRGNAVEVTAAAFNNGDDWECRLVGIVKQEASAQWSEFVGKFKCGEGIAGATVTDEIDTFAIDDKSNFLTITTQGSNK
jgi:hypothetical protein